MQWWTPGREQASQVATWKTPLESHWELVWTTWNAGGTCPSGKLCSVNLAVLVICKATSPGSVRHIVGAQQSTGIKIWKNKNKPGAGTEHVGQKGTRSTKLCCTHTKVSFFYSADTGVDGTILKSRTQLSKCCRSPSTCSLRLVRKGGEFPLPKQAKISLASIAQFESGLHIHA